MSLSSLRYLISSLEKTTNPEKIFTLLVSLSEFPVTARLLKITNTGKRLNLFLKFLKSNRRKFPHDLEKKAREVRNLWKQTIRAEISGKKIPIIETPVEDFNREYEHNCTDESSMVIRYWTDGYLSHCKKCGCNWRSE